ncbi:hypothetical protein [Brevibacillus sp. NRS-1366]|uniref:hypothetical protein n=1 Tax=Brevibacillus sp. NRS-1366 TaxID=3233899 RepID=UPI003D1CDBE9
MFEKTLEIRGIPVTHLVSYLVECGGIVQSENGPIIVVGEGWQAEMLREETVTITSRFLVNAVFIHFRSDDEERFSRLMKQFRMKVLRVGG